MFVYASANIFQVYLGDVVRNRRDNLSWFALPGDVEVPHIQT